MANETGQILSWGKCEVKATPIASTGATAESAVTFPTPVDDSTQLTSTQGTKQEAKVEGGGVVAVRYDNNSYQLVFDIRLHSSLKALPLGDSDGPIPGEFTVEVKSTENATAPKLTINRASANVQVKYTSNDGVIATYTFDALQPTDSATKLITIS